MKVKAKGTVKAMKPVQNREYADRQTGEMKTFTFRELYFIPDDENAAKYNDPYEIVFSGAQSLEALAALAEGDHVEVEFDIKSRKATYTKDGKQRSMIRTTLKGWRVSKVTAQHTTTNDYDPFGGEDDGLPF